jgi:glycosyltransferase involved in cell wall biosynthesis
MINLSIIIPTYNRCSLLKQTLGRVLQEKVDCVEIIVTDNDSQDGTREYLKSVNDKIKNITQNKNIGADANMLAGLKEATGEYVWLLCDDDLPCCNAVPQILEAIHANPTSGLISLRAISSDKEISNYSQESVSTTWKILNRDEYLKCVGDMVTFASIIVARKNFIDFEFLSSLFGSNLLPAGLALQCAGISNQVMIPDKPLLYMRGGNAGGYDAYTVFSKNLQLLLDRAKLFNYSQDALESVYRGALSGVMVYIISVWPMTKKGIINLIRYSYHYKEFYTHSIPAFIKKIKKW